ncbi:MAG: acyl carrier protein [Mycobacterium pseudokansasii]|uniref:Acyl carrier protein n=1 Tax=Mycobacterium pseudokansasii TaxID=2341080 RepID=A0A498QKT5_9MYCO|nr:acyl carrier protein [Mycobacterium pseudokansasii]KZS65804.1 hypothetical protein A4G27_13875 [Mycobacterium kansasii]MBY0389091.1 acyl carrier protein [Mycobacterium pseudokansasii]VAZ87581.1 Acyl carrier protein [Mycobacterium pseudokansasii]VAZ87963.1 Acyl carrier protein [Mycobacterium pseudokansasii]VBA45849.1 Acyl carrier protein [Mycobacterium pseudokansasii]
MTENRSALILPEAGEVVDAFRNALEKVSAPEDLAQVDFDRLDSETPLLSLPIDSVVLMSLMTELEDRFAVFIDEESAFSFETVADVADYVRRRLTDKAGRLAGA